MSAIESPKFARQMQLIDEIISSDIYNLGDQFFEAITLKLNDALGADYTFVGKLLKGAKQIETLAIVDKNGVIEGIKYDLKATPCENVIRQNPCSYAKDVTKLFPDDQLLIDMKIEGYVGVPLFDSKKAPTGILVCLYKNEITDWFAVESILMIFASRAGAELEHLKLYESLNRHKEELEVRVQERTKELHLKNNELMAVNDELSQALQNLHQTQSQLIQSEKMATLGLLTSGIAHEINNPLNYLAGAATGFSSYFARLESHDKTKTDILLRAINVGVERISSIVKGLNQFSRNNEDMEEPCDINEIMNNCVAMLASHITDEVKIVTDYSSEKILVKGNSGKVHQVMLNLLSNAIYALNGSGNIQVSTIKQGDFACIKIIDDGIGIEESILHQVTEPFFTTKPPGKGTGLGLSISNAIVRDHKGTLEIKSILKKGTEIYVNLPLFQTKNG